MRDSFVVTACAVLLLLLLAGGVFAQAGGQPLSADKIEQLLNEGVTPARVASLVGRFGVSFELTPAVRARLDGTGADARLLAAIERAGAARAPAPAAPAKPERRAEPEPTSAPARTALVVRSNVSGDEVRIDGRPVGGSGPTAHDVAAGQHRVEVRREGYRAAERDVVVSQGETTLVRLELKPIEEPAAAPAPPAALAAADGMVSVPGGPFFMGCNESVDSECEEDEKPGRTVNAPAFRIDRTEVTVEDYRRCVTGGRCAAPGEGGACNWGKAGRDRHPVNCVSWDQALAYCEWRGKRLPSEAEWEKAARGGDGRKYPWGNAGYGSGGRVANICDVNCSYESKVTSYDDGFAETAPVGSYPAGAAPSGAVDMVGNVWEWTADWYPGKVGEARVVRGGSWDNRARNARASYRYRYERGLRDGRFGFRCAR